MDKRKKTILTVLSVALIITAYPLCVFVGVALLLFVYVPRKKEKLTDSKPSSTPSIVFWLHASRDKEKNIQQICKHIIVFDLETTGVNTRTDRMVSIAAIVYDNKQPVNTFYSLVNPGFPIPDDAVRINGITNDMVSDAPSESEICARFSEFIGDAMTGKTMLVAYNSPFDSNILKHAMERSSIPGNIRHFDVLALARKNILNLKDYKLVTVAQHLGIETSGAHNAMRDCEMCAAVLFDIVDKHYS